MRCPDSRLKAVLFIHGNIEVSGVLIRLYMYLSDHSRNQESVEDPVEQQQCQESNDWAGIYVEFEFEIL